ncbi:uncharacterized protein LOC133031203 [Cannabis sativa]|uniref:uncharacterized protein LOC133031203 n=1 Tax=Cannabis sativa TaxID=3483 RepID=UPI0029CA37DB|nr:uncharacterized protein LOC133031203 [Cannabis sativa]
MKTSRDIPDNSDFWRLLWQLQLPPKVLNFLWRASTNSLPTRFHLSTKHIPIAATCPFCLVAPETTLHVLALEAGMICWSVWTRHNDLVWNSKHPDASEVVTMEKLNYVEWFNAQKHNVTDASLNWPTALPVEQWTTPDFPFVKVNVDGALFSIQGRYGLGLIVRSAAGMVLEARILSREGSLQPHIVEAIGIKEALSWSKANGWTLVADFDVVSFTFAKRSANKVAHALARSSFSETDRFNVKEDNELMPDYEN